MYNFTGGKQKKKKYLPELFSVSDAMEELNVPQTPIKNKIIWINAT